MLVESKKLEFITTEGHRAHRKESCCLAERIDIYYCWLIDFN
jgi:hypothetical protein